VRIRNVAHSAYTPRMDGWPLPSGIVAGSCARILRLLFMLFSVFCFCCCCCSKCIKTMPSQHFVSLLLLSLLPLLQLLWPPVVRSAFFHSLPVRDAGVLPRQMGVFAGCIADVYTQPIRLAKLNLLGSQCKLFGF